MLHYTPRQVSGWLAFGAIAHRRDLAEQLAIGAMAARGEKKALDKQLKDLDK